MTMPRSPSARAFATNAGSSDRGGSAKAHSRCSAPHSGQRERPQTGRASASAPSASGSGNRQKNHGTRASTAVANGSSQSGTPSHRPASATTMSRRARADSEARMEQRPPATGRPRALLAGPSLENAASAELKRPRPWRGACAAAPCSARPGTGPEIAREQSLRIRTVCSAGAYGRPAVCPRAEEARPRLPVHLRGGARRMCRWVNERRPEQGQPEDNRRPSPCHFPPMRGTLRPPTVHAGVECDREDARALRSAGQERC
jgi:hypothetical protein